MKTAIEQIKEILDSLEIETSDNSDMALLGDQRGPVLYRISNKKEVAEKLFEVLEQARDLKPILERLKSAEEFINMEGTYHATWDRKFLAFKKWRKLTETELYLNGEIVKL